jgi:hypothetical protein
MKSNHFCRGFLLSLSLLSKSYALKKNLKFSSLAFAVLFLGLFFGFSGKASAATYYVDFTGGLDTNNGLSEGAAWKTITKVNAITFVAGDSLLFKRGETWTGIRLTMDDSGTEENQITIGAYGIGNDPIINANSAITYALYTAAAQYVVIDHIHVKGGTNANALLGQNITVTNGTSTGGSTGYWIASGTSISNTIITGATGSNGGIYSSNSSDITLSDVSVTGSTGSTAMHFLNVSSLTLSDVDSTYNAGVGLFIDGTGSNYTINRLNASSNGGTTEEGCLFYNTPGSLNLLSNITIYDSHFDNNGSNGLGFRGTGDTVLVSGSTSSGNRGDGFNIHNVWTNVIFDNSTADSNGVAGVSGAGDGFSFHETSTGTIRNSTASNNLKTAIAHVDDSSVVMQYNVFSHTTNGTLSLVYLQGTGHFELINNTIYSPAQIGNGVELVDAEAIIKNNIVQGFNIGILKSRGTLTEDYNNAYGAFTENYSGFFAGEHSIQQDPNFADTADDNFSLQSNSPAINAGTNSVWSGQNNIIDYEGNAITNGSGTIVASGGTVDIGAYEFQDSTAPTTTASVNTGTYNTHQTVTLTCSDGSGVGCDKTYYSIDGTNPPTTEYSTAISIPDNAVTTLRFFSKDRSLNEEGLKTKTYTIDTVAPETTIDSNPDALININSATFTFSASETSTFQCKLDSGAYASCSTPKNYTSLSEGEHTFYVKATDIATNEDATPASYTFTVDTLIPTISDLSPDNQTLSVTTTSTNLTLTTSETTTCKYSTTSATDYASMTAFDSTNDTTHSTAISGLNPGTTYDYYMICKDVINESAEEHLTFSIAPEENKTSLNSIKIKIERETNKFKDKIYSWKNKFKLKQEDDNLANGTVKIYKDNKRIATIDVDSSGAWDKILKLKDEFSGWIKILQYDQFGTLLSTDKAKIKVDTEDPKFNEAISEKMTIGRNQKISFTATDDNSGIDYYKVKLSDVRDWRQQSEDFYQIPEDVPNGIYDLLIRAYDKAGNYAEEKTTLNVSQYRNSVSLASASLNPYNNSEMNTLSTENQIQNHTDKNTDTAPSNSSSNNSPSPQPQAKPSNFHWYNPFSWF